MTKAKKKKKKEAGAGRPKGAKAETGSTAKVHEVSDGLTAEGTQVVVQLVEKALHGDASSADAVADRTNEAAGETEAGENPFGFSQALAWASEPEWQAEASEEEAETARGSREPETVLD